MRSVRLAVKGLNSSFIIILLTFFFPHPSANLPQPLSSAFCLHSLAPKLDAYDCSRPAFLKVTMVVPAHTMHDSTPYCIFQIFCYV